MPDQNSKLLTAQEVVKILRLGEGRKRPEEALRHLRRLRRIGFVTVGRRILYCAEDVDRFIEAHRTEPSGPGSRVRLN